MLQTLRCCITVDYGTLIFLVVLLFIGVHTRLKFFEGELKHLRDASHEDLEIHKLKVACEETQKRYQEEYPNIPHTTDVTTLLSKQEHNYSAYLLPREWSGKVKPLYCYGDGNCLYRLAKSRLMIFQATKMIKLDTPVTSLHWLSKNFLQSVSLTDWYT